MLGTHTYREILTLFPGFHVMAMSMEDLEIDQTGMLSVPVHMVNLKWVIMLEVQPAISAAPALLLQQDR